MKSIRITESQRREILKLHRIYNLNEQQPVQQTQNRTFADIQKKLGFTNQDNIVGKNTMNALYKRLNIQSTNVQTNQDVSDKQKISQDNTGKNNVEIKPNELGLTNLTLNPQGVNPIQNPENPTSFDISLL